MQYSSQASRTSFFPVTQSGSNRDRRVVSCTCLACYIEQTAVLWWGCTDASSLPSDPRELKQKIAFNMMVGERNTQFWLAKHKNSKH